jgi:streptogramin lyase
MLGAGCRRVALLGLIAAGLCAMFPSPAAAITVTEFTQGLAASPNPGAPTAGPDGNVWFTDHGAIGRITPAGAITEYTQGIPGGDSPANSITLGSDGALWFCLTGTSPAIGRIDPTTGTISDFGLTSNPQSVTEGPDGNVWFIGGAGMGTPAIGYITPTGKVTEITTGFSAVSPAPEAIAPGPDGNMWFLDNGGSYAVGHVDLSTTPHTLAETSSGVDQTAVLGNLAGGPDGNVWFTASGAIGKVTLPLGTVSEVMAGTNGLQSGAEPDEIMVGPDNNLWFDDQYNGFDAIGKIVPSTFSITEYPLKTATTPWTMTFGSDGDVYVAQTGQVAQLTTSGKVTEFPTKSNTSGMDNDSMILGPDGNVYYNDFGAPLAIVQVNLDEKPTATTGAATAITTSSATISGSVTPLSAATTVSFQYGTTPALGSTAPAVTLPASASASPVSANLNGLPASTKIYYEVQAANANGTTTGAMQSLTTAAAPTSTTTTPTTTPTPPARSVTVARIGDQRLTLTTPPSQGCTARRSQLPANFTSTASRGSHERLHLIRVAFFIDKGIKHKHRETSRSGRKRRTVTVTTYSANATSHTTPANVALTLAALRSGIHTLTVRATYSQTVGPRRHRHKQIRTKTLSARFRVC